MEGSDEVGQAQPVPENATGFNPWIFTNMFPFFIRVREIKKKEYGRRGQRTMDEGKR